MNNTKPTLLYVEDDLDILHDITFLLKNYFSEIFTAVDGKDALKKYRDKKPSIVLLDINIPKISGIDVAKKIREEDEITPILFLTAYSDSQNLISAINLGSSSYIVKPFDIDELKEAITKTLTKRNKSSKIELAFNFTWDIHNNSLLYNNRELLLTKKEIQLLNILEKDRYRFFSACEIAKKLSMYNSKDNKCNNSVQLLSRFKKKILTTFDVKESFIANVYGMGYKLL